MKAKRAGETDAVKRKEGKTKRNSVLSNMMYWLKYYYKNAPIVIWSMVLTCILEPAFSALNLYFPKVTLSLVEQRAEVKTTVCVLGVYTLLYIGAKSIQTAVSKYNSHAMNTQRQRMLFMVFLKSLRLKYSDVESEEGKLAYNKAIDIMKNSSPGAGMVGIMTSLIVTVLNFVLYSTVLSALNAWMVVMLVAVSFLNYLLKLRLVKFWRGIWKENAVNERHYNYIKSSMGRVSAAKDIRIFGMGNWLKERLEIVLWDSKRVAKKKGVKEWKNKTWISLVGLVRDLIAYAYLIYMAVQGNISVSDFVLYFSAITGFSEFVGGLAGNISSARECSERTEIVRGYLEAEEEDVYSGKHHISELVRPIGIEFRDVSFSYVSEGKKKQIFSHLNLKLAPGEKLALVGVNGAGKTTLVKLLCGFYEPDEGAILLNGIDMREFPKTEIFELFSVVFQDIFFPFVKVEESIVLNESENVERERLKLALEQAGLEQLFGAGESNIYDRYMGTVYRKDGLELSGGQRQRLLLARALYKNGDICVLDEPTAALDPIAESEVYEVYQKHTFGKTSVFISHRLASTGFSDRIVLLDQGQILEEGTHEELMAKNGAYAEMFRIQSSYYKEEGGEAV